MLLDNIKKYIVYKITNDLDNTYYIGIHKTDPNIDDGYRGSGYLIKDLINKYGIEHFKRDILYVYNTLEEASNKEREIVNKELLSDKNCLNMTYGGGSGWKLVNEKIKSEQIPHPMQGKHHTLASREKIKNNHYDGSGKNNSNYKSKEYWETYNDGITNIRVGDGLRSFWIPENFKIGKIVNEHKKQIRVLVVPDIHSKRYILDKFINIMFDKDKNLLFDKVIFLGDYIDGFVESNEDMLYCLNKVIELKKLYNDKIILLLANHEFSYLGAPCSGHRFDLENEITNILLNNIHLFHICYAINDCIFSHAGLTNYWVNDKLNYPLNKKGVKANYDLNFKIQNLVSYINKGLLDFNKAGYYRSGGTQSGTGSCIWADKRELLMDNLCNCNQIVGHTPVPNVIIDKVVQNKIRTNYLIFTDTFSTYRDGTIYGDYSYLVYVPTAKKNRGAKNQFEIHYLK